MESFSHFRLRAPRPPRASVLPLALALLATCLPALAHAGDLTPVTPGLVTAANPRGQLGVLPDSPFVNDRSVRYDVATGTFTSYADGFAVTGLSDGYSLGRYGIGFGLIGPDGSLGFLTDPSGHLAGDARINAATGDVLGTGRDGGLFVRSAATGASAALATSVDYRSYTAPVGPGNEFAGIADDGYLYAHVGGQDVRLGSSLTGLAVTGGNIGGSLTSVYGYGMASDGLHPFVQAWNPSTGSFVERVFSDLNANQYQGLGSNDAGESLWVGDSDLWLLDANGDKKRLFAPAGYALLNGAPVMTDSGFSYVTYNDRNTLEATVFSVRTTATAPVPEPATLAALGLGLAALARRRRVG